MAKAGFYDYVRTALSNADINGITTAENTMTPSQVNNALREFLKETADFVSDLGGVNQTVGGTANAMTVTLAATAAAITNGMRFTAFPTAANTSTTPTQTITPAVGSAFAAKTIKKYDGTGVLVALIPGDNCPGPREYIYLLSPDCVVLVNPGQEARYAPGTLYGLTPSTNAGSATNKLDFAIGAARDSSDAANIDVSTAITAKDLSVAWAVGSTQGLLATGSAVTNTTYYLFAIKRPDTGVADFAADTSSTGANIATNTNANYTILRMVGLVVRTGGVNAAPIWFGAGSTRTTVYTASGTHTITPGAKRLFIRAVGGGGSGGGIGGAASFAISGGGGGSGSYSEVTVSAATFGASQTVTVGTGGGAATNAGGNSGGASSVGTLITANGGAGGASAAGPGAGGAAGTGDLSVPGSAGSGGGYINSSQNAVAAGSGGSSAFGGGGAGAIATSGQGVAGNAGTRGGGGGGSATNNAVTNPASGAGGTGEVIIIETF